MPAVDRPPTDGVPTTRPRRPGVRSALALLRGVFPADRLSWRLGLTVTGFVVGALALGFHLTYVAYRDEMLAAARHHAEAEARLVRLALSHEMLQSDDRSLIAGMVDSFAEESPVERVMVLDRDGIVRFSSDKAIEERHFRLSDPTCQVCHEHPPDGRLRNVVLDLEGGRILRTVQPIPNRSVCHECHEPEHRINGVLIVDIPVEATIAGVEQSVRHLAAGTALVGLVLIGGIGFAFRRLMLRRLQHFERAAHAMARGDLAQRVPIEGNDELTRLERAFNHMADAVGQLLTRVDTQRARLQRIMDSVDDGLVVLDRDFVIVAANDAFRRRFPDPTVELGGRPCWEAMLGAGACCDRAECPGRACFDAAATRTWIQTRTDAAGVRHHEEVRASPLYAADGSVERVVEVWRDITDRRSAEARLADYQRLASVGMLAAGISHEVNTPLASISTCLEAIDRSCGARVPAPTPDQAQCAQVRHYVQIATEQVRRCGGITRQFMQLARGRSPDVEIVDLPAAAALVVRLVGPTAKVAGVDVELIVEGRVPAVRANGAAVQQVLLNLLLNAVEASRAGGRVQVRFAVADHTEVQVVDQGVGIATEDLAHLFEPFFSRRQRGTGLGLFVSLNLARAWGGDVRVADSRPGLGTTFAVVFPRPPTT